MNQSMASVPKGSRLPVVEHFYTLQGEGMHMGRAAWFIRIGGCDIGCHWCDARFTWNDRPEWLVSVDELLDSMSDNPSKAVVVTGGEPLMYDLDYLCGKIKDKGWMTYLETSGSHPLSGQWDWICLSPKQNFPPSADIFPLANELKVIIHESSDLNWAEECAAKVAAGCHLLLQPEWSRYRNVIHEITEFIKRYPKWRISLQAHKFMRIP